MGLKEGMVDDKVVPIRKDALARVAKKVAAAKALTGNKGSLEAVCARQKAKLAQQEVLIMASEARIARLVEDNSTLAHENARLYGVNLDVRAELSRVPRWMRKVFVR